MNRPRFLRRPRLTAVAAAVTTAVLATTATAAGTWSTLAPVPAPTEGMQTAVVGNQIIAAYGYSGGDTQLTRIYDIPTDTWSSGSPAPSPARSEGAAASHEGFFYAVGGRTALADLDRYDPLTDTWTSLADLPTGRGGLGVAVVGGSLYAIGGRTGSTPCSGGALATVERYDIESDSWTAVSSLPSARSDLAAVAQGGKIHVFGGCTSAGSVLDDVDVYDPTTDTWSTAPADLPTPRASLYGTESKGNTIYVVGGWDGSAQVATNEAYKVSSDSWSTETSMPSARAEMGVVSHGGQIYTVGGGIFGVSSNLNLAFKP